MERLINAMDTETKRRSDWTLENKVKYVVKDEGNNIIGFVLTTDEVLSVPQMINKLQECSVGHINFSGFTNVSLRLKLDRVTNRISLTTDKAYTNMERSNPGMFLKGYISSIALGDAPGTIKGLDEPVSSSLGSLLSAATGSKG